MVMTDRIDLIEKALAVIKNKPVLINLLARRVRQLNKNSHPMVEKRDNEDNISIALREVVEGKIYPVFHGKHDDENNV